MPGSFYEQLALEYLERRDTLLRILEETGFESNPTRGAYYVMADVSHLGTGDDVEVANRLTKDVGVAVVPGSSFYQDPRDGRCQVRFAFCKKEDTLAEAERRLSRLGPRRT